MKYKIVVDKQSRTNSTSEKREYEVDIEELRAKGDVYDSLIFKVDGTYVMRRLHLSELQVLTILDEPIKEPLENVNIELFDGDNYIYLIDMEGNRFYAEYLIRNEFNEVFATRKEMNSAINLTIQEIDLAVNQKFTNYSTTEEMNASINMKSDSITSEVNKTIENIQIGGTNLIKNSAPYNLDRWVSYYETILSLIDESSAPFGKMIKVSYQNVDNIGVYNYLDEKLEIGKEYSWSVWIKANKEIDMLIGQEQGGTKTIKLTTDWQKITHKFTATDFQFSSFIFYVHGTDQNKEGLEVYIHSVKLEEGNKVTTWSPSPDDTATKVEMNSKIEQTAESINSEVRKKVGEDEIISKINQTAEKISINAGKVDLSGYVTISNLSTAGKTTINGSNITTGTIDASKATITNINADNIKSGTITGRAISGGTITGTQITNGNNFSVDANGNMTCNNANINGTITSSNATITGGNINIKDNGTYGNGQIIATNKTNTNREAVLYSDGIWVRSDWNGNIGGSFASDYMGISNSSTTEDVPLYGIVGTLGSDNVNPYFNIYNTTTSTNIYPDRIIINNEGPAMYGKNSHKYRCNWTGSQLQFWVDETNVGTLSDKRLKTEIQDIDEDFIKAIKEVEMKQFKVANRNGLISFGILAQDLIEIFQKYNKNPFDYEIVQETQYRTDDDTIYYTINYEQYLILKSKAQEQEIKELQEKDKQKDNLIQSLIERIEKLEAK